MIRLNSVTAFFWLLFALPALAKTSLNSVCYIQAAPGAVMQGERTKELFEIASISKVFTTYWALHELGAQYRFTTRIHVTPISASLVDVHVEGSLDPFWGRQLSHLLVSELYKLGIREIRDLTFDENFKLRWSVLTSHEKSLNPSPDEIAVGLHTHLKALAKEYPQSFQEAEQNGMSLSAIDQFSVQKVFFLAKQQFRKSPQTRSYFLRSSPLFRYLKEMNVVSNNHIADKLYEILGGSERFRRFFAQKLGLGSESIQFINGSGNSVIIGQQDSGLPIKQYNKGTCESLIRVLVSLQDELATKHALRLTDVMAVSGTDPGTLRPRYDAIPNAVVAKTGTVDPTVALSGVLSTTSGSIYFGVLIKTEGVGDWEKARDEVRERVFGMIQQYGGVQPFIYQSRNFLPFDQNSGFQVEGPGLTRP